jgi:hypothetical protein
LTLRSAVACGRAPQSLAGSYGERHDWHALQNDNFHARF